MKTYVSGLRQILLTSTGKDMKAVLDYYDLIDPRKLSSRQLLLNDEGSEYVGCCPLHFGGNFNEFHISVSTGKWHCDRCEVQGLAVDFIRHREQLSFDSAKDRLSEILIQRASPSPV